MKVQAILTLAVLVSGGAVAESRESVLEWARAEGSVRSPSVAPLYRSAPRAVLADWELYEYLALVDTLRLGRARERKAVIAEIDKRLFSEG